MFCIDTLNVYYTFRCNATIANGFHYLGTYCELSIDTSGSDFCVLYNLCVNATIEDPDNADEFCRTDVTTYKTEKVESIDKGGLEEYKLNNIDTLMSNVKFRFRKRTLLSRKDGVG